MSNTCGESSIRFIRAYFADFYNNIATVYNRTDTGDKPKVKQEIIRLSDRIVQLINNEKENKSDTD